MKRTLISLLALLLLAGVLLVPANANSAQSKWEGVDQSGGIIVDGDSPIVVEREVLTFDLQQFPQSYYREVEDFLAYTGKVTAEYTFYNPSDMTVTAKLLFPFGCEAQYADFYDYKHVLLLGRVTSGKGGERVIATCNRVLAEEYPDFKVNMVLPDENNRRVGQSVAAAGLPEIKK